MRQLKSDCGSTGSPRTGLGLIKVQRWELTVRSPVAVLQALVGGLTALNAALALIIKLGCSVPSLGC